MIAHSIPVGRKKKMAKFKVKKEFSELVKKFEKLATSRAMWKVYSDVIEIIAISIQNRFISGKRYEQLEQRYLDIINSYTKVEVEIIIQIFADVVEMLEENPFLDLFGDLYMQLGLGNSSLGQFFTPFSVAECMAELVFDKDKFIADIERKGYIDVYEPCLGGAVNIIALCKVLHENGIDYQGKMIVIGQELSQLTAMVGYVALSLIGCAAVIKRGNTLYEPYENYFTELKKGSEIWTTPMFHLYGRWLDFKVKE